MPHCQLGGVPEVEEVLQVIVLDEDTNTVTWANNIIRRLGKAWSCLDVVP